MKNSAGIRILLVEDEAITALALANALRSMGYQVCTPVATGEKAIEILTLKPVDVVLMDICLAGRLNGIETARRMMNAGHRSIIFITSYSCGALYEQAHALGPSAIIIKPVKTANLKNAIDSAVLPKNSLPPKG
jgi:CheY-like chemotaxis protein